MIKFHISNIYSCFYIKYISQEHKVQLLCLLINYIRTSNIQYSIIQIYIVFPYIYTNAYLYFPILYKHIHLYFPTLFIHSPCSEHISTPHILYLYFPISVCTEFSIFIVLHHVFIGYIVTGRWKGRGNQYIQLVKVMYCKLRMNGKRLPAFPHEVRPGFELCSQRSEESVSPLHDLFG